MNKNRIAGSVKEARGAAKEAIGKATGDAKLQATARRTRPRAGFGTPSAAQRTLFGTP
jgi:hypothetical protein